VVAVGNDAQWQACMRALELADLGDDASLATNAGRLAQRERVVDAIGRRLAARAARFWMERLESVGVPCGIVRSVPEVLARLPASARTGLPPSVPGSIRLPPPALGEHTALVRADGWNAFASAGGKSR
jgi:glutaryl-CoA transferase